MRFLCLCLCLLAAGCASAPAPRPLLGPTAPASVTISDLPYTGVRARRLQTAHYNLYTTIEDTTFINRAAQLMEGAYSVYHSLLPAVPLRDKPMECYLFANRSQWADFTRQKMGIDATVYLKINRGGFTRDDWYMIYFIGDTATLSVAAHEGWHQFAAHNFKGRLPPFLEEGIATTFEGVTFTPNDLPRFDLSANTERLIALRRAVDNGDLWPLAKLLSMHAGQVVGERGGRVDAFYAEAWAFARFLNDAQNHRFRPALQQILQDTADGSVFDPSHCLHDRLLPWNPAGVQAMFEHYLQLDMPALQQAYDDYVRELAVTNFATAIN